MSSTTARRPAHGHRDTTLRVLLAGPAAILVAILIMAGSTAYIPKGAAELNNIAIPLVLFPAIWAALFFWCSLTERLARCALLLAALAAGHALLIWQQLAALS